jgi:hypothetical protein
LAPPLLRDTSRGGEKLLVFSSLCASAFLRHVLNILYYIEEKVRKQMKQKKISFKLWLVIPIILAAFMIQAEPVAGAAVTSRSWKVVPTPNVATINNALNGVSTISPNNAWAVGESWNNNTNTSQTLTEQWNGTRWRIVPSPNPSSTGNRLNAVIALSATNVWAVGTYNGNTGGNTLVEHWNGSKWAVVASPNPTTNQILTAVAASSRNDIWAVGADANGTLIEHWNGTTWRVVPSPSPTGSLVTLEGVTVVSATDAWAVGVYFVSLEPPHNLTLILHWNGKKWAVVPSPSPTSSFNVLFSVGAVSASDVWAVGNRSSSSDPNTHRTMIQHWNGTKWSVVSSPNQGTDSNALGSVTIISAKDIWAVGDYYNGSFPYLTLTEHWNGTNWAVVASPNVGTDENTLLSVTGVPETQNVWAVGEYIDTTSNLWKTLAEYYS